MSLSAKILSLNIGTPAQIHWRGRQTLTSMRKQAVAGPLVVHPDHIEGNSFANPQSHGTMHSVLYAYGLASALEFAQGLGLDRYIPGSTGETLTLDDLDEDAVSVGDIFEIGEVIAQATFPRIPCGKVNFCMQHPDGQKAMIDCGRSGVYFRILKPGLIHATDLLRRTENSTYPFPIGRLYELITTGNSPTADELEMAKRNPAFLEKQIRKWEQE